MKTACLVFLLLPALAFAQTANDTISQVDPFIGTKTSSQQDNGETIPGAARPFGMLYWSPDGPNGQIYSYENPVTRGFSLTHLSGCGCYVYGDVPIFPMLGTPRQPPPVLWKPGRYQASFRHADEVAQPGYYSVKLDSGIRVQIAAGVRSGIAKFTYPPSAAKRTLLIDLSKNLTRVYDAEITIAGRKITGAVSSGGFCGTKSHYRVYFVLEVDRTPAASGTFNEMQVTPGGASGRGPRTGGYLSFDPGTTTVHMKAAISFVSVANAEMNMDREIPGWDLEKVRQDARSAWSAVLGHALVTGGSDAQRRVFYTALYHAMLHPSIFSDVNGEYLGFDNKVHTVQGRNQYANYSGWDIYRSEVQLITMLLPKVGSDIAQSLVADSQQSDGLPVWPVANDESGVMAGDPSDEILAGIYAFGGHDFDTKAAMTAMLHGATDPTAHIRLYPERPGLAEYLSKGYIPNTAQINGAASVTLEDTSADFAIAQFGRALGNTAVERQFLKRSGYWRNIFDPETKYIRARDKDGKFLPNFKPGQTDGFIEGDAAQYTLMVPYDLTGLVNAMGGPEAVKARLDDYFSQYGSFQNQGPYFFIANEPSFGNPWIYNWAGYPWRTQEVVRKTIRDLFTDKPDGEPGNDDLGATSSWIVFAQLGFFPEIPGVGGLTTNSPVFPDVTLMLGDHPLQIIAAGAPARLYVKSIALDGARILNWWIDWDRLAKANKLVFTLTGAPNKNASQAPPSYPGPN
ncbi:MAG: GH92 family glycosyl hydrolase [Acidobacteriaceae bacterium]